MNRKIKFSINFGEAPVKELLQGRAETRACISQLARSTSYYYLGRTMEDKYATAKKLIADIFHGNKGRYGYRRVTAVLKRQGHNTVSKIMGELGLKCNLRPKRYRSYKGNQGIITHDLL